MSSPITIVNVPALGLRVTALLSKVAALVTMVAALVSRVTAIVWGGAMRRGHYIAVFFNATLGVSVDTTISYSNHKDRAIA